MKEMKMQYPTGEVYIAHNLRHANAMYKGGKGALPTEDSCFVYDKESDSIKMGLNPKRKTTKKKEDSAE